MNRENLQIGRQEAIWGFDIDGTFLECTPCGNGHINDTFMMSFDRDGETHRYSLQHMNRSVFRDPVSLMNNILHVTDYLKEQIRAQGGDPQRETLDFVCAKSGEPYFIDSFGEYWRAYHFVEDAYALEEVKDPQDFYQSAVAFGNFQRMLADFPADTLTETIAGFHDTKARFAAFEKAVEEDVCGRAAGVQQEIRFIEAMYDLEVNKITACEAEKEYYEALSYTFELSWLSLEELPFIRSEEGIIISNIADIYHDMGNLKKSEELFEKLSSVYQKKQMFLKINSSASAIILGQYSRLLGDIMNYKKALYIDSVNLQYELNDFNLIHIENLLYNQAWAYYEIDREQNNKKIQRKFWVAQRFAEFNRKEELINLLKMRENKYMKDD